MTPSKQSRDLTGQLIKHVLYPLWEVKNRSHRLQYAADLEKSQHWSREKLQDHQWSSLCSIVRHAYETCPFYKSLYDQAGFSPEHLHTLADMLKIPTITKQQIQENRDQMISVKYDKSTLLKDMTGGSTGSPMQFYYDDDRLDSRVAATIRHNRWAEWDIGDRVAVLWGAPRDTQVSGSLKDKIRDWIIDRRLILDASSLDDAAMQDFSEALLRYKPRILLAYANTLGLFARYVQDNNIQGIRPQAIVCSAEVLTSDNRALIEETFECKIFNRYGSREFAVIASECDQHVGMHVNAENLYVETLPNPDENTENTDGEILITDLKNYAMPMIRYRTKDVGRLLDEPCRCGRALPLLELSGGRVTDFLVATNGKKVSGIVIATYVITNIRGVQQIQFIQDELGAIALNLVRGPDWTNKSEQELISKTKEFLGDDMQVNIVYKSAIPHAKSGKYLFSVSNLSR